MKIECHDHTVKEILQSAYYEIPRFQRPYSWEKENLEEFWKDVFKSNQQDYFIGSIVTYKTGDARAVVDGQQRLTTLTILLAVLRNAFDLINSSNQADGIQRLIERYDLENKARFVLATETSYPYLQFAIQNRVPDAGRAAKGYEDEFLSAAHTFLLNQVNIELEDAKANGSQSETAIKNRKHKRIEQLRDIVLSLKLILVQLDNEDDAYLVFETLNTRGKDLTTSDLLKNHLARLLRATNARGDIVRSTWVTIMDNIKTIQLVDVSIDDFVYHYWLAKNDFAKARDIFKLAKKVITTKVVATKILSELDNYSEIYRNIFRSNLRRWRNDEVKIKSSIEVVVNRFRVRQPLPLMLTAMYKYEQRTLTKSEVERLLWSIELFTFVHAGLMSARSSGGVLQMYAAHARELSRSNATSKREKTIDELISKLRAKLPTKSEFVGKFASLQYSDTLLAEKRLVQYSLTKLIEIVAPSLSVDAAQMSIEHIAPQSGSLISPENMSSIGNLWYVNTLFNNQLGSMVVERKLNAYRQANMPCDDILREATEWTGDTIERRAIHLAELMWEAVDAAFQ